MKLYEQLDPGRREKLFAFMRSLDEESDAYMSQGRTPHGTIPVGAAGFDETLKGAARLELVSALRRAPSLEVAQTTASAALREWVTKHNQKRPKDVHWRRWTESGQDELTRLVDRVKDAIS